MRSTFPVLFGKMTMMTGRLISPKVQKQGLENILGEVIFLSDQ